MYKRVLVATNGSALSERAVATAIDLALLSDAELIGLHVELIQSHGYFEGAMVLTPREMEGEREQADRVAQHLVDTIKAAALAMGVRSSQAIVVRSNQVAEAIV